MTWLIILVVIIVIGAISGYKTLTNTFAVGIDTLAANIGTNSKLPITISSRTGLAARRGKNLRWCKFVNWIMRSPTHCEQAIGYDIARSLAALDVLFDGKNPEEFEALKKRVNFYYLAR